MDETLRMLTLLNETFPDLAAMTPEAARAAADARIRPAANADDVDRTEDVHVDGGGHAIPLRAYHPHDVTSGAPVTVFAHGGGFLHGSIASHDGFCRLWAKNTGGIVLSVDYRLAPEVKPPASRDDVVSVVDWARDKGLAPDGVLLAGDSAGGNLAAGAAIVLRDRGDSPVVGQVLLYPFLDPSMSTESHRKRGDGYFVTRRLLAFYWRCHLGESSSVSPADVTPLAVEQLTGLPPAIVVTAGLDPLCDEGREYARRLRDAGASVLLRHHPDQFHGFLTIPGFGPAASASDLLWADLRTMFPALLKETP